MKCDMRIGEAFHTRGWEVVEDVFAAAACAAVAELAVAHVDMKVQSTAQAGVVEARKVNRPFLKHQGFRDFILNLKLRELLRQLLGGGEPLLVTDQIFMKPPRHGSPKHYHQDNAYFQCDPADHVVTAWVALDDADEANGCLRYIEGSHRDTPLPHTPVPGEEYNWTPDPALIDLKRESCAVVKRGGVVFHHGNTLHCSGANRTDRWRRAYASHWVTADVTCRASTLDDAYFKLADYPRP